MLGIIHELFTLALSSPEKQNSGCVYIPEENTESEKDQREAGSFHIPKELFPIGWEIIELSAGEDFLEDIVGLESKETPPAIIMLPPFCGPKNLSEPLKKEFRRWDLSSIAVRKAIETLPSGSKLGVIMPYNFCSDYASEQARSFIATTSDIEVVISFSNTESPFLGVHQAFKFCIVIIKSGETNQPPLKFFHIPETRELEDAKDIVGDFNKLLLQDGGKTKYGYVHRDPIQPGEQLLYGKYHPDLKLKQKEIGKYGSVTELHDIGKIRTCPPSHMMRFGSKTTTMTDHSETPLKDVQDTITVVSGRDILIDGSFNLEEARYIPTDSAHLELKAGDICFRQIAMLERASRLVFAEVKPEMLPLAAAPNILVLTLDSEIRDEDRELVLAFLGSEFPIEWLLAQGATIQIQASVLGKLPVPLLDEDLKNACRSLSETARQFDKWKKAAEEARSALFEFGDVQDSRLFLLTTGRNARQRREAAALIDNFDYRVRTRFPYPIAYKWSTIKSSYPNLEGYVHILECVEILACYISQVIVLITQEIDVDISATKTIAQSISKEGGGVSMGIWIDILRKAKQSKKIRKHSGQIPFYEFITFLSPDVDSVLGSIKKKRDDNAHGAGPKDSRVVKAYQQALKELETLLSHAEFLSEYPLRFIEDTRVDSIQQTTQYKYRDVMGDNPLVPLMEGKSDSLELETGSLYLVDKDKKTYLLRPLLHRQRCPECDIWSTFCLDNYNQKNGQVTLKSLEHEHKFQSSTLTSSFRRIGLVED